MASRYLNRRMDSRMRDGRNPYGSRGGYVSSRRRGRGRDRGMGSDYNYSEHDYRYDSRMDSDYGMQDSHYGMERYGESRRPMDYEMYRYGVGGIRPMMNDYARGGNRGRNYDRDYDMRDYRDYGYDYASGDMEKEWEEKVEKWCKELKKHDKFNMPKEEIVHQARQMGAKFNEYNEKEFLTTYYMMMSDYKMDMLNSPQAYMILAKDFLEDSDSELKGSDKLCAYYYEVVKGGEED